MPVWEWLRPYFTTDRLPDVQPERVISAPFNFKHVEHEDRDGLRSLPHHEASLRSCGLLPPEYLLPPEDIAPVIGAPEIGAPEFDRLAIDAGTYRIPHIRAATVISPLACSDPVGAPSSSPDIAGMVRTSSPDTTNYSPMSFPHGVNPGSHHSLSRNGSLHDALPFQRPAAEQQPIAGVSTEAAPQVSGGSMPIAAIAGGAGDVGRVRQMPARANPAAPALREAIDGFRWIDDIL